jgi:hypothetical protein
MWAFVDIGFAGGVVMVIILVVLMIRESRTNSSRISSRDKARIDRRCNEGVAKIEERMAEFKKEYPDLFADE